MSTIAVLMPTRDRPEDALRVYQSMLDTSTDTKLLAYVDNDQRPLYGELFGAQGPRLLVRSDRRLGPVEACNAMVHYNRDPIRIYGAVPDDARFKTRGWDRWLIEAFEEFPGRIGVVAAAHNVGEYVNFPWVSREWIESGPGWYFYPHNFHHCCDTVLEMLGEATAMRYASPKEFEMHHEQRVTTNREQLVGDAANFLTWCVGERRSLIAKIRANIQEASLELVQ